MRSRYLYWQGRYTVTGPYRKPSLLQRLHRWLSMLVGV